MKYLKIVLPAILLALSTSANASVLTDSSVFTDPYSTVDGFDDLAGNEFVQDRDGYSISSPLKTTSVAHIIGTSGTNVLSNFYDYQTPDIIPISFYFDELVTQAGAFWETDTNNTLTIQAFLNGNLIDEASFVGDGCCTTPQFFGFTGFEFDTLTMSSLTGTGNVFIDDLSFTSVSAVPVPAAAWLFGSALLGFFGFSRRKANA